MIIYEGRQVRMELYWPISD